MQNLLLIFDHFVLVTMSTPVCLPGMNCLEGTGAGLDAIRFYVSVVNVYFCSCVYCVVSL